LKELILETLDEKELSKKELLSHIMSNSHMNISDKTFNESLMSLLKDGKICMIGYDFSIYNDVKRIQSIRPDGIIFSLVKTDFFEIESLIKKLDSGNEEEVRNSSYKLKRIFRNKINELEEEGIIQNVESADTLFNRIVYYIDSQQDKQKKILNTKLAWSLSDVEGDDNFLEDILKYIKAQGVVGL
jgi:DNA-binding HxlR family transcriptional regulator